MFRYILGRPTGGRKNDQIRSGNLARPYVLKVRDREHLCDVQIRCLKHICFRLPPQSKESPVLRPIAAYATILLVFVACTDEPTPTEPRAKTVPAVRANVSSAASGSATSSVCAVNRRTLAALDGQLQQNPSDEALKAEVAVQAEITADICD